MRTSTILAKLAVSALLAFPMLTAGCAAETGSGEDTATSEGEQALTSNERTAFNFFVGKGLSHAQAAGIVGNLIQESNVLPGSVQYGGGPGRGIAQWSVGGRWNSDYHDNVAWFASNHGMSPWALNTQLEFIWYELTTFSGFGLGALRGSGTVAGATIAFERDFEGCGQCDESTRIRYAEQVLAAYGPGGGATGGGSGGGGSCYSSTLGRSMPMNACVQSRSNSLWYQCNNGTWVDRWNDPAACNGTYPL